jgi:diphosphomevalonate decarboxylase
MPTAIAHPNIALVKYWGKRDLRLNLPAVPSLSVTLDRFCTTTRVELIDAPGDEVHLNDRPADADTARKTSDFLDLLGADRPRCRVDSANNFPTAAGLASSSSGFAALALAGAAALGLPHLDRRELSIWARRGSGSASRSLWGGYVVWQMGTRPDGRDSHGVPLAPAAHWDLRVVVGVVSSAPKSVGSTAGMQRTVETCPLYPGFAKTADADLAEARQAVLDRDLERLGQVTERSTLKMHATMIATVPSVRYWKPSTVAAMDAIEELRRSGVGAWYTLDAGPNLKVICAPADAPKVVQALVGYCERVETLSVGGEPRLLP